MARRAAPLPSADRPIATAPQAGRRPGPGSVDIGRDTGIAINSIKPEIWVDDPGGSGHRGVMDTNDAASRLEALGNPTRLSLFRALVKAGHGGLSVGECQQRLAIAQSTLSFHLKALIHAGLVTQERQSRTLICRANFDLMNALVGFLVDECCVEERCRTAASDAA
jgi:DNA-binding transcriptional ArsR family regulator